MNDFTNEKAAKELTQLIIKNILNGLEEIIKTRCELVIEHALNCIEKEYNCKHVSGEAMADQWG